MNSAPKRFVDHVLLWIRWRWLLIGMTFFAMLLMFIVASLIPKTYRATAVVLPPFEGGVALPFLGGVSVDVFGANEVPAASMTTILRSRALMERVQKRIDLKAHYKQTDLEKTQEAFTAHLQVEFESEESLGAITILAFKIHVLDHDPAFSAELLHVVVDAWDALAGELNRRGAALRRQFVEASLQETTAELGAKEDSLRVFQEKYGIAQIEAQFEGTVSAAVLLEQRLAEARIAVEVLNRLYQPGHPLVQRAQLELEGLMQEKKKLQADKSPESFLLTLKDAPELSITYYHLYRDVRILQAVYEVLLQSYQQAKIQELKETPSLRIVDRGEIPLYKFKPRRALLSLAAGLGALFITLLAIYFGDYFQRAKGTEEFLWLEEAGKHLGSDLKRLTKPFRRGPN